MANEMTYAKMMEIAVAAMKQINAPAEAIEKGEKHLEMLSKPRKSSGTSKTVLENQALARKVYEILPDGEAVDYKWIVQRVGFIDSSQKCVAVSVQAKKLGLWEKVKEGRKTVYQKL